MDKAQEAEVEEDQVSKVGNNLYSGGCQNLALPQELCVLGMNFGLMKLKVLEPSI